MNVCTSVYDMSFVIGRDLLSMIQVLGKRMSCTVKSLALKKNAVLDFV